MRKFKILTFTLLAFLSLQLPAFASIPAGTAVRLLYSVVPVGGVNWVPLINTTARYSQGAYIHNDSQDAMALGLSAANSAANSETAQLVVPAHSTAFVPMQISAGQRLSVISLGVAAVGGELDLSLVYY